MLEFMKNLFKRITEIIKKLFMDAFEALKLHSIIAVKITDKLKSAVESEVTEFIIESTNTESDDELLEKAKNLLPKVALKIALIHGIVDESSSSSEVIGKLIDHLKSLHPDARIPFWVLFSGELNMALADGKISLSEAFILAQLAYTEIRKIKK
jgi:hypothetical protein